MTRPIEFRAQRADTREWVYGVPYFLNIIEDEPEDCRKKACIIQWVDWDGTYGFLSPENKAFIEVLPETVGQFTGLLDRNGKKIFEGDVLTWRCSKSGSTYEKNYTVVIEWPINAHSYSIVILDKKKRFATQKTYWNEAYREVIGTIHDKPEKP